MSVKEKRTPAGDEWWTPDDLFQEFHREFNFTVDAFANEKNAKLPRYFGRGGIVEDGLDDDYWRTETVWANPPYSLCGAAVSTASMAASYGMAPCRLSVLLLPANRTEQPFWQQLIEPYRDDRKGLLWTVETRFIRGRRRFGNELDPTGKTGKQPTFGLVACIFRPGGSR